jgi:hypothetical protein
MLADGVNRDYGVLFDRLEGKNVAIFSDGLQGSWKVIDSKTMRLKLNEHKFTFKFDQVNSGILIDPVLNPPSKIVLSTD